MGCSCRDRRLIILPPGHITDHHDPTNCSFGLTTMKTALLLGICFLAFCHVTAVTDGEADIIFVVDSSDRVGAVNFELLKTFLRNVVSNWTIGPTHYRVGIYTYGDGVHVEAKLSDATSVSQLLSKINSLHYFNAPGDATEAIRRASQEGFLPINGGRAGEREIIIHIGSGPGSNPTSHADQVKIANEKGIVVYNVAVGDGWTYNTLSRFASDPPYRYSLPAVNYNVLVPSVADTLINRVATEIPRTISGLPTVNTCVSKADIVFCLDGSTSVTSPNFLLAKENLKSLVSKLPIAPNGVHVGLVQFSGKPRLEFSLTKYTDRLPVLSAIDKVTYMRGGTETGLALKYIRQQVLTSLMGARMDVPRIIILLTDGQANNHAAALSEASLTRVNGITIIAVGIGSSVNQGELLGIAGASSRVYSAKTFQDLNNLINPILTAACEAKVVIPPPATTADPKSETCVDKITTCDLYIQQNTDNGGFCANYVAMAKESCARSCGYCTTIIPTVPVTPPPCVNKLDNCTQYSTTDCMAFSGFFGERCALMCGLCDIGALTPGFHNQCMYKSKIYQQGERWSDGCDYDCVCTDAAHGKYECTAKCDVYHDLPSFCTLVLKPGSCCLEPVCHFETTSSTYTQVSPGLTPDGKRVCSYLGQQFYQNQHIDNGCVSQCICVDATLGHINCTRTCPNYVMTTLPSNCYFETVPGSCCKQPRCELHTTSAIISGFGTISEKAGYKAIYDESKQPPCIDLKPECPLYGKDTCEGNYRPFMTENCPVYCGLCKVKYPGFVPGPDDRCMYNGVQYTAGQTWSPDCEHECVCDTQYYGFYRCYSKCPQYTNVPTGCKLEKLASDCCPHISCPVGTKIIPSTINVLLPTGGTNIYLVNANGVQVPILPKMNPDGTINIDFTAYQTTAVTGCLFNGQILAQGEISKDGNCGDTCQCLDEAKGLMSCTRRCPTYAPANSLCTNVVDPFDACCMVPSCPLSVTHPPTAVYSQPLYIYGVVKGPDVKELVAQISTTTIQTTRPTPTIRTTPASHTTYDPLHDNKPVSANLLPTLAPGVIPNPNAGNCTHQETGHKYREGERWTVGCKENCLCVNGSRGLYVCSDMCVKFVCPAGYNCTSYPDPEFPCCNLLQVNLPGQTEIKPTSLAFGQVCHYNNKDYKAGETWQEGCEKRCKCSALNSTFMSIQCSDLCPHYISLPPGCNEVKQEGQCCPILVGDTCSGEYCLDPSGVTHLPGETWREGCQYECTCTQKPDGFYRQCRGICPTFPDLSKYLCTHPTPRPGKCCALPDCCVDPHCTTKVQFDLTDEYKQEF